MNKINYYGLCIVITLVLSSCGGGSSENNIVSGEPIDGATSCTAAKSITKEVDSDIRVLSDASAISFTLSSSLSKYNPVNDLLEWRVYVVTSPSQVDLTFQHELVGIAYSDEELKHHIDLLPSGTYQFELVLTTAHGVADSVSEYLSINQPSAGQAQKLGRFTRFLLKQFIWALSKGAFNYFLEEHMPCETQTSVDDYLIPRLQAVLDDVDGFFDDVERELTKGLVSAGVNADDSGRIAGFLVDLFF